MTTIHEVMVEDIERHYASARRMNERILDISRQVPELLDLEIDGSICVFMKVISIRRTEKDRALLCKLLELSGKQEASKYVFDGETPYVRLRIGPMSVVVHDYREKPCKRYRVLEEKEIEVCGKLDESKYAHVEEIG